MRRGENKGGRPAEKLTHGESVSERQVAKELGVPQETMRRQIAAADAYDALPLEQKERVDRREATVKQAQRAVTLAQARSRTARRGYAQRGEERDDASAARLGTARDRGRA